MPAIALIHSGQAGTALLLSADGLLSTEEAHLEESLVGRWDYQGGAAGVPCSEQVLGSAAVDPLRGHHWAWATGETMGWGSLNRAKCYPY